MKNNDFSCALCPDCRGVLAFEIDWKRKQCERCRDTPKIFRCKEPICGFQKTGCLNCDFKKPKYEPSKFEKSQFESDDCTSNKSYCYLVLSIAVLGVAYLFYFHFYYTDIATLNRIGELKREYPTQKNETWHQFLSVLEKEPPSVKSITLLHGKNKSTTDCLTNELVSLYSHNKIFKTDEITFSSDFETKSYGFALEHYRKVVLKFRIFIADLTKVTGNIARIFHALCDDTYPDFKPSLFIFTLKYDEETEYLKPLQRATTILKKAWSDLSENEIHSLLSRIVRTVVDIIPEKDNKC